MPIQISEPQETSKHTPIPRLVVGIDLGTTHSLLGYKSDNSLKICPIDDNLKILPSVVYRQKDGSFLVGNEALKALEDEGDASRFVFSTKRLMGRNQAELGSTQSILGYALDSHANVLIDGVAISPVEVASLILQELKLRLLSHCQASHLTQLQAVITVPAYFDNLQRQATRQAAELSGIQVLRLLSEPTAAAIAYDIDQQVGSKVLVYDFGGGTFDVSILEVHENGVIQVQATNGDSQLGGDDIDQALADYIQQKYTLEVKPAEIRLQVKMLKESLGEKPSLQARIFGIDVELTQEEMEEIAKPLIDKTLVILRHALRLADLQLEDLESIILVGGTSLLYQVQKQLREFTHLPLLASHSPLEVVALGATKQAVNLTASAAQKKILLDVLPLSLGIETYGGLVEKIIPRNSPLPAKESQEFTTYVDGQTKMQLHILQGERENLSSNRSLAKFVFSGIPPLPAGMAKVKIVFEVDENGMLKLEAQELVTGKSMSFSVNPSAGLSDEAVSQMLLDSFANQQTDLAEKQYLEEKFKAEQSLGYIQKYLDQDEALNQGERREIEEMISRLRAAIANSQTQEIKEYLQKLEQASENLVERGIQKDFAESAKLRGLQ